MRPGDPVIFTTAVERNQIRGDVVSMHPSGQVTVRCLCGCLHRLSRQRLRPAPRVYVDGGGRVALHVVKDDDGPQET